ncbi:hypothetical protein Q5H93_02815 [Hymenobacter sp. ASUV-10]|uniref:Glycosyltransferase RgtA/B/C/D-like domain-containing protein n=1 Tax=Hymenobacter aranciens TaxID=3063996 RepID=A0ABT9B605_9BACT|nr:hypothetical protein [Hymenobacter sp. ASUV-10]MDO7873650.1 hypothetical protein [Hymenobacter sp. ASUV-10]
MLNVLLLTWLLPWLRRQWQAVDRPWRAALLLGLGGRLLVGGLKGWHPIKDAAFMAGCSQLLTDQFWASPGAALQTLLGNEVHFQDLHLVYYGMSNTFFIMKLLGFLNLFSAGSTVLNGLYLALASFLGCWLLARELARTLPGTPAGAGLVAFVLWPTVLFWATGISKEAVFLGSGAGLLALVIRLFWGTEKTSALKRTAQIIGLLVLAIVYFKTRYFFAMPLLGALVGLAMLRLLQPLGVARSRWAQTLLLIGILAGGAWLAAEVSVAFRLNKLTNQTVRIYDRHLHASLNRPHFEYPDLRPTPESMLQHAPLAALNALTRPWLGESWQGPYLMGGLENLVLLALLTVAAVAGLRGQAGHLPFALGLALGIYCLALAVLLGLSTPNLGSLSRYRSGLLPFLLLLLLQNDYAAAVLTRLRLNAGPALRKPGASNPG